MKILFNPAYVLKPDGDTVLLLAKTGIFALYTSANLSFSGVIHPIHAIILSQVDGSEYEIVVDRITSYLNITKDYVKSFIDKLINNEEDVGFEYKGAIIGFPKMTIITDFDDSANKTKYSLSDFLIDIPNLFYKRHNNVSFITIMLNNLCYTDCYYCYADKRIPTSCKISLMRLKEVIAEAKKLNVVSIDLIGGEVFLYKYWKELLKELVSVGYYPFISTKLPLSESMVADFQELSLPLQFSLDSLIPSTLVDMLNVSERYRNDVVKTLSLLNKYNIPIAVHTILTQRNITISDMQSIYDVLKNFSNIIYWKPDIGNESIYSRPKYRGKVTPSNDMLALVYDFFKNLSSIAPFKIKYEGIEPLGTSDNKSSLNRDEEFRNFLNRAYCAGNFSQLFILPDGEVTICEELYWHPHFIIGNIINQDLHQIWTSEKALSLYNVKQHDIAKQSLCSICKVFDTCRKEKQICYRDIVRKFGLDNWDRPDILCPLNKNETI